MESSPVVDATSAEDKPKVSDQMETGKSDKTLVEREADDPADAASEPAHVPCNSEASEGQAQVMSAESMAESGVQNSQASKLYPALSDISDNAQGPELDSKAEKVSEPNSMAAESTLCNEDSCEVSNKESLDVPNGASDLNLDSSQQSKNTIPSSQTETMCAGASSDSAEKDKVDNEALLSETASAPSSDPGSALIPDATSNVRPDSLPTTSLSEVGAVGGKSKSSSPGQGESVYYVKWIVYNGSKVPIITQNENGPCPLLAIMNVLLLKGKVRLAPLVEMITSEQLMAHLGDCVVESKPKNLNEDNRANYEQNMQDAMNLMYKLQTGLDVNVKFTGVSDFEYTSECIIFDLLEIALYHGWLVDPQDEENVKAVGKCSYNQLVEKVIQNKQSDQDNLVQEALIAEQFLDGTASQLTYHGLCELSSTVKEQELCVFFRNNHFNTLYRHNNELFLLVTDQGFLTEGNVVWETLSNVDGDCHFVDANFCTYTKPQPSSEPIAASPYYSGDEQINSDYQVALSLQHQDQQILAEQEAAWGQFHQEFGAAQNSDHELALRLQEEEDRRAAAALHEARAQQAQGQPAAPSQGHTVSDGGERRPREERRGEKKEGRDCSIL